MKFTPRAINPCSSGRWVKARLSLPSGLSVEDVNTNAPVVLTILDVAVESDRFHVLNDRKGCIGLNINFERAPLCALAGQAGQNAQATVTGSLNTGQEFMAADNIRIVGKE